MTPSSAQHWGILPTLGHFGGVAIPAYGAFMLLALLTGLTVFMLEARRQPSLRRDKLALMLAAIIGGVLGAKIPVWIMAFRQIHTLWPDLWPLLSGRTVVGGLIGGALAVVGMRRYLGITEKSGNLFAPAIALGLAIGRIGCFCAGCCYGVPTSLPWGVTFGDGIARHPTQLYESAFALALFIFLLASRRKFAEPGRLFGIFMIAYFAFRFLIEFLRAGDIAVLGLTWAQIASLGIVGYYINGEIALRRTLRNNGVTTDD